jgi:putative flippase GtrA
MEAVRAVLDRVPVYYWGRFEHFLRAQFGISPIIVRFLIVGGLGYLINQSFLFILYDTSLAGFMPAKDADAAILTFTHDDVRLLIASIIAVELSIFSNFYWHDRWTFRDRVKKPFVLRYLQFNATSIGSPLISVVVLNILTPYLGVVHHLLANTIGILMGTSWNWFCNTHLIWRKRPLRTLPKS